MECPHCHKEIPSKVCRKCGTNTPEESLYCMHCGVHLTEEEPFSEDIGDEDIEFEDRILCPDGTCTGIIVNGKCTECGRSFEGDDVSG